jgi:large subunit ribosomal protein L9
MEVVLREDYLPHGYVGDVIKVRGGFARNFLIPRGIAMEASARNVRVQKHNLAAVLAKRQKRQAEAEEFGKILSQIIVEITLKSGEQGRTFGSVTVKDIEAGLKALGYTVDRKQIRIVEAIKAVGLHKVDVKLHSEVVVAVQIKVIADRPPVSAVAAATEEEGAKPAKRSKRKPAKGDSAAQTSAEEQEDTEA